MLVCQANPVGGAMHQDGLQADKEEETACAISEAGTVVFTLFK